MAICVSADSKPHLYTWHSKPGIVRDKILQKPELFLQHGVLALKRVENLFGSKSSSPMKYFITSSCKEQDIVVNEFGYPKSDVPVTGLARWDVLKDKRDGSDNFILVMPTWRSWLDEVSDEAFVESDYFRKWSGLLRSDRIAELLEKSGMRMVFYLHPKFARYIRCFDEIAGGADSGAGFEASGQSHLRKSADIGVSGVDFETSVQSRVRGSKRADSVVSYVEFGKVPLNELMMRSTMLITDYSSVCWDMLYMNKPVIFYMFDRELYLQAHGSYIDPDKDLPGEQAADIEDLASRLNEYHGGGFRVKPEYADKAKEFFAYKDSKNCERIYNYLIGRI